MRSVICEHKCHGRESEAQTGNRITEAGASSPAARKKRAAGAQPLSESEVRRDRRHPGLRRRRRESTGVSRREGAGSDLFRVGGREGIMNCEEAITQFVDYWRGTLEN